MRKYNKAKVLGFIAILSVFVGPFSVFAADAAPAQVSTEIVQPMLPLFLGDTPFIASRIRNDGAETPFNVDMEIYDSSNVRVAQKVFENEVISASSTGYYIFPWFPTVAGEYTIKLGLFNSDWSKLYEWTDNALRASILPSVTTPTFEPLFFPESQALTKTTLSVGSKPDATMAIHNLGFAGDALVDIEVFHNGSKVGQAFYDNQHFLAGETKKYAFDFTMLTGGDYDISVGIFKPGWNGLIRWYGQMEIFTVGDNNNAGQIYQDTLKPYWENWSWNTTVDFSDTALVSEGSNSIKVTYNVPWAGMYLAGPFIGGSSLEFDIAGAGASGQQIQLYILNAKGGGTPSKIVKLDPYVSRGIQNGIFKHVSIPLIDMDASGFAVEGVVFQEAGGISSTSVNIDNLRLQ